MYMCVWVYVSINACVKGAIIQFHLPRKRFSFSLSQKKSIPAYIHSEFSRKKIEKASIYTLRLILSNDCLNHNEPSVSGVCPFIITPIHC